MPNLRINGDVRRTFIFPASVETGFAFYADIHRLIGWLKHIALVRAYDDSRLRLLYHTTELGLYGVSVYCDIEVVLDQDRAIRVRPLADQAPLAPHATVHSLAAQGSFHSESFFHDHGDETQIDYHLQLEAVMPIPAAAQILIPKTVLGKVAQSITYHRIDEIADEFIRRSLAAFSAGSKGL